MAIWWELMGSLGKRRQIEVVAECWRREQGREDREKMWSMIDGKQWKDGNSGRQ